MIKSISQFLASFYIILCSFIGLGAQNNNPVLPLTNIIGTLETVYHVQFNYAEDIVSDILLKMPDKTLSLDEAIIYLNKNTTLSFTMLDSRIVLIKQAEDIAICGYIKDFETLEPLPGATIQTLSDSVTSEAYGFFKVSIKSLNEIIEIRYLGYKTIILTNKWFIKGNCSDVFLKPNFQSLKEIIISNYLVNGINKINNGSYEINFLNFDMLPGLIETDVLHSLQALPGIQSINETVSNINIRGGTHDQNLILWDDIKMYQSGHFFGLISMFNPEITQKVSLLKNGTSTAYTDGVSGSIKMQTSEHVNTNFKGIVGINLTNVNGFADFPIGKRSSLQLAGRKSTSDFFETPTYKSFFDRISQNTEVEKNSMSITNSDKSFDFYDTSLRWIYKISEKDELRLNFINVHNELLFTENAVVNGEEDSRKSKLSQNSIAEGLQYKRVWNNNLQSGLEIYETDYKLKSVNANVLDSQRFLQENAISETSFKLKTDYKLNDKLQLLSGYHFVETQVTNLDDVDHPLFRLSVSEVLRTHGIFSEIGYRSLNKTTYLNFGMRYNYLDKFKKQIWEPRLSFNQKILSNFTFEILGELKHQNTSQIINFQNDFLGVEKRRWQLSNNVDIPIIKSMQASMGINYSNNGWLFNVEGYYKRIDGITSQSQGFQNQYEFAKAMGSYDVKGFDVLLKKNIHRFNSWISYAFMENLYTFKGFGERAFPSNFNITHAITLGTVYKLKNIKMSAGFNWHTGKPTTELAIGNQTGEDINYGATNTYNLKDYSRLDISALYDFKSGNKKIANFGISVWNILNRKNEINSFYRINNGVISETVQNSLGITPNAVLRIYF